MADGTLKGNNRPCEACGGRRRFPGSTALRCEACKGIGFTRLPDAQIVERHAAEACEFYWPAFDARTTGGKG